jgi:hypothetical protein
LLVELLLVVLLLLEMLEPRDVVFGNNWATARPSIPIAPASTTRNRLRVRLIGPSQLS